MFPLFSLFRRNTLGGKLELVEQLLLDSGRLARGLAGVATAAAVADVHAVVVAAVRGLPLRLLLVLLLLLLRLLLAANFLLAALDPLGRRGGLLPHGPRGRRDGGGSGTAEDGGGGGQVGVLLQPLQEHVEHGDLAEGPPLALRGLEGRRRHRADVVVVVVVRVLLLLL